MKINCIPVFSNIQIQIGGWLFCVFVCLVGFGFDFYANTMHLNSVGFL